MNILVPRDLFFFNVGETSRVWLRKNSNKIYANRRWENCVEFNFMSAGQGLDWSSQLGRLEVGDIFVAYITEYGYSGIGEVDKKSIPINNFKVKHSNPQYNNKLLRQLEPFLVQPTNIFLNENRPDLCEYIISVNWQKTIVKKFAYWEKRNPKLFSTQQIVCSLDNQPDTKQFIADCFEVNFI